MERYRENEIRLRYELDLAKQLAADNLREAESAKALLNVHLLTNPSLNGPYQMSWTTLLSLIRKFTRDDLSVTAPSLVACQSHIDDEVHNYHLAELETLRSEIVELKKSHGTTPALLSSTTTTTLPPAVPSVTTVLAYPSKSDAPIILRWLEQ